MSDRLFIGIDNGVSGALAAVHSDIQKGIVAMTPVPILRSKKANEVDILLVRDWINSLNVPKDQMTIVIEEPGGSKSASAASSMAGSFHSFRSMCILEGYRWHRITPRSWQKAMLSGCKAGDTKKVALTTSRQLWPGVSFLANQRSRVPHDGMIDAALIAEYARRNNL